MLIDDKGVYKTSLGTPGLLVIEGGRWRTEHRGGNTMKCR